VAIEVGQKAPEFKLYNTEKKEISLNEYKGKNIVLLFFPFAFSSTCTKEMCEMCDNYSFYSGLNADVVGISVDSLYANKKFKEVYNIPFTFLSDFNKEVSRQYDSLYEDWDYGYKGVSKRSVFVINKDGNIAYKEILPKAGEYPNMQTLKNAVESLKN
jgi:glutaredoxin-dependent peroxiredoxin